MPLQRRRDTRGRRTQVATAHTPAGGRRGGRIPLREARSTHRTAPGSFVRFAQAPPPAPDLGAMTTLRLQPAHARPHPSGPSRSGRPVTRRGRRAVAAAAGALLSVLGGGS
jgi:hypothetical protein